MKQPAGGSYTCVNIFGKIKVTAALPSGRCNGVRPGRVSRIALSLLLRPETAKSFIKSASLLFNLTLRRSFDGFETCAALLYFFSSLFRHSLEEIHIHSMHLHDAALYRLRCSSCSSSQQHLRRAMLLVRGSSGSGSMSILKQSSRLFDQRADPVVNPGAAAGHVHTITGGSGFNFSMTYDDARASQCSTCNIKQGKQHTRFAQKSFNTARPFQLLDTQVVLQSRE